ncbi:MAG: hypothetical protein DI598_05205 [Pseudopedobacter saltans]|uniref:Thioredoxin domain-containing protein n=1 Tax=Pseudopedobacter saltans TaxID=151895 RepID=A0A2W5HA31_9SPHI|nr:MAG: hypothetical protein DI598_05205 [Pseudopedobacter saltans]
MIKTRTKFFLLIFNILIASISFGQSSAIYTELEDSIKANAKESNLIKIRDRIKDKSEYSKANNLIMAHYPKGQAAAAAYIRNDIAKTKNGTYTIAEYESLPGKFPTIKLDDKSTEPGYYYESLMKMAFPLFIRQDSSKTIELAKKIYNPISALKVVDTLLRTSDKLWTVEQIAKVGMEASKTWMEKFSISPIMQNNYAYSEALYTNALAKRGEYSIAKPFIEDAFSRSKKSIGYVNETYITFLNDTKDYKNALEIGSEVYKKSTKTQTGLTKQLQIAYSNVYPNKSFDTYLQELKGLQNTNAENKFLASVKNDPIHDFTLKDLQGNVVTLSKLKGKIVILDFWATWCVPCKESFPGMQLAINQYKDNKDVVFLFIDTYENINGKARIKSISDYISDKKFTFQVLLDEDNKTVKSYGIDGIPHKVIIGKDGNVKFRMEGYPGSSKAVLDEVTKAVDYLSKN